MRNDIKKLAGRYGLALATVAAAALARVQLDSVFGLIPFLPFFLAVLVTASYAGLGPGLLATLLGLLSTTVFPLAGDTVGWAAALLRFGVASVVATILIERVRRSERALRGEREMRLRDLAEVNQTLKQRVEELQTLLEAAPVAIWVAHDPECRVVTANRWARAIAGTGGERDGEAMAPTGVADLRALDAGHEVEPAQLPLQRAAATGVATRDRELEILRDGQAPIHVTVSAAPLHDDSVGGAVAVRGAIAVAVDVTARRHAEQATAQLAAIVESSDDAVIGKTLDGTITSWNAAAQRLYGYSAAEVVGRSIALIVPPERPEELSDILSRLERGERMEHYETDRVRKDGTRVEVSATISPILGAGGKVIGASAISRDVSERRRTAETLRESEERYRGIVSHAAVAISQSSLDGTLLDANPGLSDMLGATTAELIGRNYRDLVHADDWPRAESAIAGLVSGAAVSESLDLRYCRPDGGCVWVRVTISIISGVAGLPRSLVAVAIDVSQRRRTEATLRFLAEASESLSALIDYRATLQTVATLAVPDFADWCAIDMLAEGGAIERLAVAHVDPTKVKLAEILHRRYPPDPEAPYGGPRVLRSGVSEIVPEITDAMIAASLPDDERRTIAMELGMRSYMCVPLRVKERTLGVITYVAAESGRRYDERDLTAAEDLARRAAIAIENARLYQELRESDRRKDEFLAVLSHELRNPLAPIRSGIDMLAMDPAQHHPGMIDLLRQQVEHLIRLVDDLLDVSRITRGRVELRRETIELGSLLERSAKAMQSTLDARRQTLVLEGPEAPVWLDGDPVRLLQVLENLLQNASKFSDPGTSIELSVERHGGQVAIRVRDRGIGMDASLLPRLFQPFTQASRSLDRTLGGLGIGLALARGLVERHGGTISATSAGPGEGSEFVIRLPLLALAEEGAASPASGAIGGHRQENAGNGGSAGTRGERRILVVDDNVAAAQMLSLLLSRLGGHQVSTAHDGQSAVEKVRSDHPEIVLLDIGLPTMDGYEVGRAIRQDPRFDDVLMVALTGYGQEEDRRRSRDAGFDEHLVKPPAMEDIERLFTHPKLKAW